MSAPKCKHKNIVSEPMEGKLVTELAGIGEVLGERLTEKNYATASAVLDQFLLLEKDENLFKEWLNATCKANSRQQNDCFQCLNEYSVAFSTQQGPSHATDGPLLRDSESRSTENLTEQNPIKRPLNILQWNAEGVRKKRASLTKKLNEDQIDIACIQETHLNPNHQFSITGYKLFRLDRQGHKGGVLILIRNSIPSRMLPFLTNIQEEIIGVDVTIDEDMILRVYNVYCPPNRPLSLAELEITSTNCLVVGDFNSHSERWGYTKTDDRGMKVEDWEIDSNLQLINKPDDTPTFYSRGWKSSSTPDLAFSTGDINHKTKRTVLNQLSGSDHKPIKLMIDIHCSPPYHKPIPRWNYKRADWKKFTALCDTYCGQINTQNTGIGEIVERFNKSILRAALESIPRGARKDYKPYWTEELQELEKQVSEARDIAEKDKSTAANITYNVISAKYKNAVNTSTKNSWIKTTETLNLDKDGRKLWRLAKVLNNEECGNKEIAIQQDGHKITGKKAANVFIGKFSQVSQLHIPPERKRDVITEQELHKNTSTASEQHMTTNLTMKELEEAIHALKTRKSPGKDGVTNEMLKGLGSEAKRMLLKIMNLSWKRGIVPQAWKEATMIPILKKGKDGLDPDSYNPISLLSCTCKLMEIIINTRLSWHLEKKNILLQQQAGFRQHRSTEDQVTHIAQEIEDAMQEGKHTLAAWIDIEKAFDKVWKDGLRVKMLRCGVHGRMYNWISHYLENRTARVQLQEHSSKKSTIEQGVPQGGALSPTLFLVYINDITENIQENVHYSLYADDMAMWTSEEHITTAGTRMQNSLTSLENWSKMWMLKINEQKTTYTVFSLSNKQLDPKLQLNGRELQEDETPTYLGITLDRRMTWKTQIIKTQLRAKLRMSIMKKLAGTTWGADESILKKLYMGTVRPVLEYGITAWSTTAKSHFGKINRLQNQAARIITGALKSTPIIQMENITGLQPMKDRRDSRVLQQAEKYKRLTGHPMYHRMNKWRRCRLKRSNFVALSKEKISKHELLASSTVVPLPATTSTPLWKRKAFPELIGAIPGILVKKTQPEGQRKCIVTKYIEQTFPLHLWTHAYTDGSSKRASVNGGGGIYIKLKNNTYTMAIATGKHCSNFNAEAKAMRHAAEALIEHKMQAESHVVIFTDALSLITALKYQPTNVGLSDLVGSLEKLANCYKKSAIQWVPAHCNIPGNEEADRLAEEGGALQQVDSGSTYDVAKTIIRAALKSKWEREHPGHINNDAFHQLSRRDQVTIFRLRTGNNRLRYHMYYRFRSSPTDICTCGPVPMTAKHLLQTCPTYNRERSDTWQHPVTFHEKLYGAVGSLELTAAFFRIIDVDV